MDVLNLLVTPISEVIKCFSPSIGRRISYIARFKRNVDSLRNQEIKLKEMKIDVQRSVEAARRNGEVIKASVEGWLTRVDDNEREVTPLFTEIEEKKGCFQLGVSTFYGLRKRTKTKLNAINELLVEGENFNNVVSGPRPRPQGIETMPIPDFKAFESTQKAMDQIIKHLKDDEINFVGVYGMGGIGKTTLMKEVAKQVIEDGTFSHVVMVTVTQNPILKRIQGQIAANLGLHLQEEECEAVRARRLFATLKKEKEVLIILDDMWGRLELVDVGIPCGDCHKNCKVVITSRIEDVCRNTMDTDATVQVEVLSHEDSWLLFQKNVGNLSPSLGALPQEVAEECGGLPIAIVTLARALRNKSSEVWRDASRQLKKSSMTDIRDMQKVVLSCIKLSYDFIESKGIKLCFLFCCLFPEDDIITVKKMMYYGMGERIFGDVQTLEEAMDRVHAMFENLVASSLLLRAKDYEGEFAVVMHDVVRDAGIAIASEEENGFLVRAGIGLEELPEMEKLEECKRMSFMGNKLCMLPDQLPCPQLLTLLLSDNNSSWEFHDRFFERMRALAILDLSGNHIMSLPSSFLCLTNLRSLHLNFCELTDVSLLGNLKTLEILCLKNCSIQRLPEEIGGLKNLRLLDLSQNDLETIPPNVLSRLSRLEELYLIDTLTEWEIEGAGDGSKASLSEVVTLRMLTTLHLNAPDVKCFSRCNSTYAEKLKNFEIVASDISVDFESKYKRNMCLKLNTSDPISDWINVLLGRTEYLQLQVSDGLSENVILLDSVLLNNLRCLDVFQCHDMKSLISLGPNNINLIGLQSLEELIVEDCNKLTNIFNLPELEQRHAKDLKLRKLVLTNLSGLSTIWRVGVPAMFQIFQQLEELMISGCNEMVQIISVKEDESTSTRLRQSNSRNFLIPTPIFQNLKTLTIEYCESLKHFLPIGLAQGLLQLEQVLISDCYDMEEIIAVENEETMGKVVLPRLRSLQLCNLTNLLSLCRGLLLLDCPSLEEIGISECPNFKNLSLFMDNVSKLKKIYAEEEWLEGLEYDGSVKQRLHQLLEKPSRAPSRMQFHTRSTADKMLERFSSVIAGIWSENISQQHEATTQLRKLLSTFPSPPIEEVIRVVPRLVEFLGRDDFQLLQLDAAIALTNIASETSEYTKVIIDHGGAVPKFVEFLDCARDDLCEPALLALGYIAEDTPRCKDLVLGHGALIPLLARLNEHTEPSMLRIATWTLSNFCKGDPQPPFEHTKLALEAFERLIHSNDDEVLTNVCVALSYLSDGTSDKIQAVIEAGVCPRLVELLLHPSSSVLDPVLRTIGNIALGDDIQIQYIINHQALPCLLNLLSHNDKKKIKMLACRTISNITNGNNDHIQAVIDADIMGHLIHLLKTVNFDIKKEAAKAISNATSGGTHDQIKYMVSQGCIKPLCDLLVCPDPEIVTLCLNGLKNILIAGEAESNTEGVNLYAQLIDDAEGLEKIHNLKSHENITIHKKAVKILERYRLEEDD